MSTKFWKSILTVTNDHYLAFSPRGQCTNQSSNYKTTFFRIKTKLRIRPMCEVTNYELFVYFQCVGLLRYKTFWQTLSKFEMDQTRTFLKSKTVPGQHSDIVWRVHFVFPRNNWGCWYFFVFWKVLGIFPVMSIVAILCNLI